MKKLFAWVLSLTLVMTAALGVPVSLAEAVIPDGAYEGAAQGYGGEVKVSVLVKDDAIAEVEVTEHQESRGVSDMTIENMPARIVEAQSYAVDAIAGATYTANAIKYAVKAALESAGAAEGMFDTVPEQSAADETRDVDVVIVGAGIAGLSAAIEAKEAGADVLVLEKLGRIGGSSIISGGIVYATGSPLNKDVDDDPADMAAYYQARANGLADEVLLSYVAENSGSAVEFLMDQGVQFNEATSPTGTSPAPRGHFAGSGADIMLPLYEKTVELGIEILMEMPVTELLSTDGTVTGVVAEGVEGKLTVNAKAVIMAAGGFDASKEMKERFTPDAVDAGVMTSSGSTGDYIPMAEALGAAILSRGGVIGLRGTNAALPITSGVNSLSWVNTLAVTDEGVRFQNESDDYPIVYSNMLATGRDVFYWIHDSSMVAELCEQAVAQGKGFKGDTIEDLAAAAGMDPAVLTETVDRYNALGEAGVDEDFGKATIAPLGEGPYYAVEVTRTTIGAYGGLTINTDAQVLLESGDAIPGFYAAGECASAQMFDKEYPASGTMLGLSTTFGRTAGRNAAAYAAQ